MSQHDFVVSDNACASVRTDINNAFQALASLSSGANAPSTPYPYQLWVDTSNNTRDVKIRNGNNDAWVKFAEVQGNNASLKFLACANNNYAGDGYILIRPEFYDSIEQGAWVLAANASYAYAHYLYNSSNNQNDALIWKIYMAAGNYSAKTIWSTAPSFGGITIYIDDVQKGTLNWYSDSNNAQLNGIQSLFENEAISTPGIKSLKIKVTEKFPLSTGYYIPLQAIALFRTA